MNQSYSMFDLVLHVLSQFTTGLLYPLMMLLMSILSTSLSKQLNNSALTPAQTARSAPPGSGLDGMITFWCFTKHWFYGDILHQQEHKTKPKAKLSSIKFVDPYAPSLGALPPAPLPAPACPLCSARAGDTPAGPGPRHHIPQPGANIGGHHSSPRLVPPGLGVRHKLSTQNLKQLSTALTGRVALVNVQCFKCLGLTFRERAALFFTIISPWNFQCFQHSM